MESKGDNINNGSFITQPPNKQNKKITNDNNISNKKNNINNLNNNKNINNSNLNNNINNNSNINNNIKTNKITSIKNINNNKNNNTNNINNNANININKNINKNINNNKKMNNNYNNINNNNFNNTKNNLNSDKKSSITVAIRIRPLNQKEVNLSSVEGIKVISTNSLLIANDSSINNKKANQIKEQQFFFDYVFDKNTSQQKIYESTTKNLLPGIIEGFNATVFAYGATGSGKTYTMLGTSKEKGIMPRSISDLFKLLNNKKSKVFTMKVSYIEIYNEIIRDLLLDGNIIDIHEDPVKGVFLQGANEIEVENTENFYDILYSGNKNRTIGSTNNNETSSRSHAVLRIILDNKDNNSNDIISGKFILVDLAGSEKTNSNLNINNNSSNNSNNKNNVRQNEGSNINKSLLALGVCINALASKNKFIPWRNSKLTRILKESLGGNSRIVMISTVSPSLYTIDETMNTLVYSNRAKNIQTIIKKNVISSLDHDTQVNKYDEIISNLTAELEGLRHQLAEKTHKKHLLPKKELSSPNIMISGGSKMEKLSKEINSHFNEERRYKIEILETRKNINSLMANIKDKEFTLYKLMNKQEINKSSSAKTVLKQNYLKNNQKLSSVKEKEIKSQINKINEQLLNQKNALTNIEDRYNEIKARRSSLENAIAKYGSSMNLNSNSNSYKENTQNFNALQYLYQSYVLEISNLENDYLRKKSLNEIRSKDIKIQKLVEQLKIRDEYISQEKKQLSKKKIKYFYEGEKDIKKLEELNIDKTFSLPFIIQQENNNNAPSFNSTNRVKSPNINRVNQISNGRYDYSGYCNPNIVKEKKVIKTKTNEIMRKTKKSQLSELELNMLNDQYKNSKVFYVNKGTNPNNLSFSDEYNVITFDTRKLNKSHSNSSFTQRSQDSLMSSTSKRPFNYKEREIDNKIKKIMVLKKRMNPYMK